MVDPSTTDSAGLPPVTPIRPSVVAKPLTAKVKGVAVVVSFSLKLIVPVLVPPVVGLNWTVKVVLLPAATDVAGGLVMVKGPVADTVPMDRAAVPEFEIVKVWLMAVPPSAHRPERGVVGRAGGR